MEVTQQKELLTQITKEMLGETTVLNEDLSNLVDVGTAIENVYSGEKGFENAMHTICDKIGKTTTVNRLLSRDDLGIYRTAFEWGSIWEKIKPELPQYTENADWTLEDGASYDDHIYYQPKASVTFFNGKSVFGINMSRAYKQLKSAFQNPYAMSAFLNGIESFVLNSYTMAVNDLQLRTVNSAIGETVYSAFNGTTPVGKTNVRAVNLLYKYNTIFSKTLTADNMMYDKEFLRFMASQILIYMDRVKVMSKLFNGEKQPRHTPRDLLHIILHADFVANADIYLQSDTFHDTFTKLPYARTVPNWQATGDDFEFDNTGDINVITGNGKTVNISGVIGIMFDHDALGVYNEEMTVDTSYTAKARFFTNYYKWEGSYFNALDENVIVFYGA